MSMHRRPVRGRRTGLAAAALAVAALTTLGASAPALAAKGGGGKPPPSSGGSSLTLVLLNSPDGVPNWGEDVTFSVSTTATPKPSVNTLCYQGGALVYAHSSGFYPEYPWQGDQVFTLKSGAWTGGAADCTAQLRYVNSRGSYVTLATLNFQAGA